MLENVKNFVSEKMEKVEDFCDAHFCSISVAAIVGCAGSMVVLYDRYLKMLSNRFKDLN